VFRTVSVLVFPAGFCSVIIQLTSLLARARARAWAWAWAAGSLEALEQHARSGGKTRVILETGARSHAALALFIS
jgi:hypothetical protein